MDTGQVANARVVWMDSPLGRPKQTNKDRPPRRKQRPTTKTLISQIDYNEVGQVLTKHLHSVDSLNYMQNIAYTYNERGWLLSSSAPLFAMQLQRQQRVQETGMYW